MSCLEATRIEALFIAHIVLNIIILALIVVIAYRRGLARESAKREKAT
jgi:hypothetical protein